MLLLIPAYKKYGQGKWNSRDVVREDTIGAHVMLSEWSV